MMKSTTLGAAAFLAVTSFFDQVSALEHPMLASTADFEETWIERPEKTMIDETKERRQTKYFDSAKRPVIGVLTEPMRGDVYNKGNEKDQIMTHAPGYVPRTHVQFLEQAGIRVVPVDYRLSRDELVETFDQLNGLYIPGDSQQAVTDETYKSAFVIAMAYAENEAFVEEEHFPVFMMGNSMSTWVRSKQKEKNVLTDMKDLKHTNSRIDLVEHPDDTYLFNRMTREEKKAVFNTAQFFNMQGTGLRPIDLKNQPAFKRHLKPLALYTGHDIENN